jgi:hypothetical protein
MAVREKEPVDGSENEESRSGALWEGRRRAGTHAIAKSFGRVNNYKIDPNQELVAIGLNNIISTFFGA